ncbi:MAG: DEAD/DEAH box helicase, partial [Actinomycetota bacterium]|nr:DEAD/DEAH box helicase [Actinomycetota bacterium]
HPPDLLITTPESLYLLLTSQARETLKGVQGVIVDEIHALAGSKRGAHLSLSLERLEHLVLAAGNPAPQRIGLSATQRPLEEIARYLGGFEVEAGAAGLRPGRGGARPVAIVDAGVRKTLEIEVVVPVEDMGELGSTAATSPGPMPGEPPSSAPAPEPEATSTGSIWPHVEERIVDLVEQHRSTIVFANSRRLAERLTARLNEIAATRAGHRLPEPGVPAQVMAQSGASRG